MKAIRIVSVVIAFALFAFSSFASDQEDSATPSIVTSTYIVKYRTRNIAQARQALQQVSARPSKAAWLKRKRYIAPMNGDVITIEAATQEELAARVKKISRNPHVEYIHKNGVMQLMSELPNDYLGYKQWNLFDETLFGKEPSGDINVLDAWDKTLGFTALVGVLDTGITDQEDLQSNLDATQEMFGSIGADFVADVMSSRDGDGVDADPHDPGDYCDSPVKISSWHGTRMAGIIAAEQNNEIGISGIAPEALVTHLRSAGACGLLAESDYVEAIYYAAGAWVNGLGSLWIPLDVINLSFAGRDECTQPQQDAIDFAIRRGVVVVAAAGNSPYISANDMAPANCNGVITVAATNRTGDISDYSSLGSVVDVAAPGGGYNGLITQPSNFGSREPVAWPPFYDVNEGTSQATAHVTGVVALIKSIDEHRVLRVDDIRQILQQSAQPFADACEGCGAGLIDAAKALDVAEEYIAEYNRVTKGIELQNGQAYNVELLPEQDTQSFYVMVPFGSGDLSIRINANNGDADLYVHYGFAPNTYQFECAPYQNGSNETCTFAYPKGGEYFIALKGFAGDTSNVSIVAEWTETANVAQPLNIGTTETLSGASQSEQLFVVNADAVEDLVLEISGGSGDADLYVKHGSTPSAINYDCRPYLSDSNEQCTFEQADGDFYVLVKGYSEFNQVTLSAN